MDIPYFSAIAAAGLHRPGLHNKIPASAGDGHAKVSEGISEVRKRGLERSEKEISSQAKRGFSLRAAGGLRTLRPPK
jgi:hypothetical protein